MALGATRMAGLCAELEPMPDNTSDLVLMLRAEFEDVQKATHAERQCKTPTARSRAR